MDSDEEEDGPAIGKRPKQIKQPNPRNEPKREREAKRREDQDRPLVQEQQVEGEQAEQQHAQPVQHPSKIPLFGYDYHISDDWTTSGLFDDPIDQYEDSCGSVVFTRLLQARYNKDRPIAEHRKLSYRDLAQHIRGNNKRTTFSFTNLNTPIKYLRDVGVHRNDIISGPGVKTKGDFDKNLDATREVVFEKMETVPLGIIIKVSPNLFDVEGMDIYHLPADTGEIFEEHALLILAKGVTNTGLQFLVVQNSWGAGFANNGYFRISLPNITFRIFWPHDW